MKTILLFIITAVLAITSCCGQKKVITSEDMLLEFYSKLFYIYENVPVTTSFPADVRYSKLDSLIRIYCTSKLRYEAKEIMENGYGTDLLTNDYVGDLNENLSVKKDSIKESEYIVSFLATYAEAPGGKNKKQVVLHVTVKKEGDGYLIDSVK